MAAPLPLAEALDHVLRIDCAPLAVETRSLADCLGRVLAEDVRADGPWPSTDRAAMDGFALRAGDEGIAAGTRLPVVGESLAGHPFAGGLRHGQAIRIMTGAVVPPGADAVVPVELTSGFAGELVELQENVARGDHIRPAGSEVGPGQLLLRAGTRLTAAAIGALAVLGRLQPAVRRAPVIGIVATGDEVVPAERAPARHQVRESNSWAMAAQVQELGCTPLRLGIAPDEPAGLRAMLQRGLAEADVLVTIGGVSKGSHDLVHGTLVELGVRQVFHGIALKPGKPTFFGAVDAAGGPRARFVFGLPGNPASSFTVFDLLVRPLLRRLLGEASAPPEAGALLSGAWSPNRRLQALPAALHLGQDGGLVARLLPGSPSGDPFGLLGAHGYVLLPGGVGPGTQATATVVPMGRGIPLA